MKRLVIVSDVDDLYMDYDDNVMRGKRLGRIALTDAGELEMDMGKAHASFRLGLKGASDLRDALRLYFVEGKPVTAIVAEMQRLGFIAVKEDFPRTSRLRFDVRLLDVLYPYCFDLDAVGDLLGGLDKYLNDVGVDYARRKHTCGY